MVFSFLLLPVMQLRQNILQLFGDWQTDVRGVFQEREALVSSLMVNFLCRIGSI